MKTSATPYTTSNQEEMKAHSIPSIQDGLVIDHIQAGKGTLLLRLLQQEIRQKLIILALNLPSTRMKLKDLIKVQTWEPTPEFLSQIAIFSPQATINIIHDHRVTNKYPVPLPDTVENIVSCPNTNCITNHESVRRIFSVKHQRKEIELQCQYCEKTFYHFEERI